MDISSDEQDVIDRIVGTIQTARAGNADVVLQPHIYQVVALCDELMSQNPSLREFVLSVQRSVNAIATQKFADKDANTWHHMADEINRLVGD